MRAWPPPYGGGYSAKWNFANDRMRSQVQLGNEGEPNPISRSTVMTYKIAMAISRDAAERHGREAGRESWNADDYACAAEVFQKCVSLMKPHERARYDNDWSRSAALMLDRKKTARVVCRAIRFRDRGEPGSSRGVRQRQGRDGVRPSTIRDFHSSAIC